MLFLLKNNVHPPLSINKKMWYDTAYMKDISPILASLGFTDSETKTYLAALTGGPGTVIDLSKRSKLSRQSSYSAIDALTKRGLMSSNLIGKKRHYAAEDPDRLLSYAKRHKDDVQLRIRDLEEAIPELSLQIGGQRPIVRMLEGKEGLRAIIEDYRQVNFKEAVELTDLEALYTILKPEDLEDLRKTLTKSKVKIRGIYAGSPGETNVHVERKLLPKELSGFKADIGVRGDRVAFATLNDKMHSVIIESKEIAQAMHVLFTLAFIGHEHLTNKRSSTKKTS